MNVIKLRVTVCVFGVYFLGKRVHGFHEIVKASSDGPLKGLDAVDIRRLESYDW